ncbi:autophagy-related protein 18b-like [Glycine soja]|uniref:autophagy-related protein 18b n=1 Tax=Glycine max TaxID=3847 RepID=UPI000233C909|nr:autophagy-related protein 18b [Glycine max]XP_028184841.1 autophagy-related protein 18b-like [Glycine soja]|eukprot:XP_003535232.1 autophagy-related protein 18b [Glycine max]
MANHSSLPSLLCASFNQDHSYFVVGTKDGVRIFDTNTGRLCYQKIKFTFVIAEMLFSSSLLAIIRAGDQPSLSPCRLCLFNTTTGAAIRELNFLTSILDVCMNRQRLIVILQDKAYAYEINSLIILDTIDTMPNIKAFETHNLIKELNVKALQHIRQIAQESSGEIEYGGGRQPVVLITFSQRLCRGFNDVVNGYVDDGWSLMEWKI